MFTNTICLCMFTLNKTIVRFTIKEPCLHNIKFKVNLCTFIVHKLNSCDERIKPLITVSCVLEHHVITVIQTISFYTNSCNTFFHSLIGVVCKVIFSQTVKVIVLCAFTCKVNCVVIGCVKRYVFK